MIKIYYCSACSASQAERDVIFQLINDLYICSTCVEEMGKCLMQVRLENKGNQHLEDGVKNEDD